MSHINLMYHDVFSLDPSESGLASSLYKIDVASFEQQLIELSKLAAEGISLSLTFDDGGSSFYTIIADLLEKYHFKGLFFVATAYIGKPGFLSERDLFELDRRGHAIGTHSHTQPDNMTLLSNDEINEEWSESVRILSRILGQQVSVGSIPNGYESDVIIKAANLAGVSDLYTSLPSVNYRNFLGVTIHGRFVVLSSTGIEGIKKICTSAGYRRTLLVKWYLLLIPKKLLGNKYETVKNLARKWL